jgi:uncharacterized membrane protein
MCLCIIAIIATVLLYSLTVLVMMCFSHIHTRSALHSRFTVFCVVLPLCTPAFVGDGLATTAPCFATYPHSNCAGFCRLYSRRWFSALFNVSVYHCYHCHCSSVLPHCVGDDVSSTHTHTERTLHEVYSVLCCTPPLYSRFRL